MSLSKLEALVSDLPMKARGLDHVIALRDAAGQKINDEERAFLQDHYQLESKRYQPTARLALAQLAGVAIAHSKAPLFELGARYFTKIDEQSALCFVPKLDAFVAVDDETASLHFIPRKTIGKGGKVPFTSIEIPGMKPGDLEGVAFDPDKSRFLVLNEGGHTVTAVPFVQKNGEVELGQAKKLGKLPAIGSDENKGWEGLAYLSAKHSPDKRAHLLAVHEGSPRRLGLFDPKTLETREILALPPDLDPLMKDLSDLAVQPKKGGLALLSDESRRVAFLQLSYVPHKAGKAHQIQDESSGEWALYSNGTLDLPELDEDHAKKKAKRLQPEGLSFDAQGNLWVSAEGDRSMMRFDRTK